MGGDYCTCDRGVDPICPMHGSYSPSDACRQCGGIGYHVPWCPTNSPDRIGGRPCLSARHPSGS